MELPTSGDPAAASAPTMVSVTSLAREFPAFLLLSSSGGSVKNLRRHRPKFTFLKFSFSMFPRTCVGMRRQRTQRRLKAHPSEHIDTLVLAANEPIERLPADDFDDVKLLVSDIFVDFLLSNGFPEAPVDALLGFLSRLKTEGGQQRRRLQSTTRNTDVYPGRV